MSRWKNFTIWRNRLPHWRADGVLYYVTFRHRRPLLDDERQWLLRGLLKTDGRALRLVGVRVDEEQTQILFRVVGEKHDRPIELSDVIERVKTKVGKQIIKSSGERWSPFYAESFDRIVRDDAELAELQTAFYSDLPEDEDFIWLNFEDERVDLTEDPV